ncbi:hypothetical protein B5S28_g1285 [[Candida] boidinii]|nr:hypothetical protein B5S28_g1285 [[Candida] boidinii]OWB60744.1 hypothetical protein B5S29_g1625 [[Candida] boidinii]
MSSNGWLDKRFVCLFFSSLVALAAGTPYLYGVYSPQLMTRCGFTASDSSLLSFGTNIGSSIGGLPAGLFIDHFGPQKAVFFGAILECGGFVILYVNYYYQLHYIWLLFFAMIFVGLGSVLPYFATLKIATANFPNHRGTANAFPVSSYGLSALVYSTVAAIFFNNNTEGLLKFIAIFVGVTMGVSVFFVKLIPPEEVKKLNGTTIQGSQLVTDLEDNNSSTTGSNDQVVHSSSRNIPPPKELDSSESGYGALLMGHRGSFANVNLPRNESSTSLFSVASNMSFYPNSSSGTSSSNSSVMLNSNNNSSSSLASLNKPIRINNKSSSNNGMNAFHGSSPFRSYTGSPSNFLGGTNQQRYSNSNNSSLSTSPLVTSHNANNHNSATDLNQISNRISDQQQQQMSQFGQQSPAGSNKDASNSSYFNSSHGPGASAGSGSGANFTIGSNNSNNNTNGNAISSSFGSNRDQTISQLSNSFKRAGSFVFRPMNNSPRQTTNKLLNLPSKPSFNKFNESSVIDDESTLLLNNTVTSNTDISSKDYGSTVSSPEGSPPSLLPQQEQQQQQQQQFQFSKNKLSQKQNNILSLRKQKPKKSHKYNALSHVKSLITNKLFLSHWILLASFCSTGQVYIFCVGFIVKAQLNKLNDFPQVSAFYSSNSFLIDLLNFFKRHPEYSRISLFLNLLQFDSSSLPLVALSMYNNSKNPDDLSSAFQALQVSILSFSNFLGRLISGPSSDIVHKKLGYQRIWVIMIGLVLMTVGQLSLVIFDNISLLSISSFLIGTAYGTAYGTYPAVLADFFGAKGFTTTWGLIGTGPIMIFLLLSKYFGYDYDKKSKFEDGVKICDLGKECYDSVFYLNCFICLGLFFGFSLMIWYKRKHH